MPLDKDDLKFNFGCASCGYKNVSDDTPLGRIPVNRIIENLDSLFDKNDLAGAGRLLDYWRNEARVLRDKQGELTIASEQMGYFRKTLDKERAEESVARGLELIEELGVGNTVSSATIYLNAATTMKAFGNADKAIELYEKTRSIYNEKLSPDDLLFGGFYNNFGLALTDLGRFDDAEKAYLSALDVVLSSKEGKLDGAITYVNMAHLYEDWERKTHEDISLCLDNAYGLLSSPTIDRNGYCAFVMSKCAPSFRYFGRESIASELEKISEELYERA